MYSLFVFSKHIKSDMSYLYTFQWQTKTCTHNGTNKQTTTCTHNGTNKHTATCTHNGTYKQTTYLQSDRIWTLLKHLDNTA